MMSLMEMTQPGLSSEHMASLMAGRTEEATPSALWGYGPQDMGRTIGGGPAHKIKACTALLGVHLKTLYSTK